MRMTEEEIKKALDQHRQWLNGDEGAVRADLTGACLGGANLRGANMEEAKLTEAKIKRSKQKN